MSGCHVIRLRGPWEVLAAARDGELPPEATRVAHPAMWPESFADYRGPVQLVRRFGRPLDLNPQLAVWLVMRGGRAGTNILLNGRLIGRIADSPGVTEIDVTQLLADRNELCIEAADACDAGPPDEVRQITGDVQLEIRGEGA